MCRRPTSNPCQPGTSCARRTASRHLHHSSSLRSTNKHPTSCQLHHKLWGCLQHQGCSTTAKTLNTTDKWLGTAAACYCHMLAGFIAAGQADTAAAQHAGACWAGVEHTARNLPVSRPSCTRFWQLAASRHLPLEHMRLRQSQEPTPPWHIWPTMQAWKHSPPPQSTSVSRRSFTCSRRDTHKHTLWARLAQQSGAEAEPKSMHTQHVLWACWLWVGRCQCSLSGTAD